MIWKIAKKEFLLSLMTFKFALGTIVCVALTTVFVPILTKDYQQRLRNYNDNVVRNNDELRKVKVYKNITPTVYRPPAVLSVFSERLERRLGSSARIELDNVPEISAAAGQGNPYLSIFSVFDVSSIFKIVISVLALLVAYDAVSGEREQGTLRLTLSGTTARYQVLLGKLLAGLIVLVVPVTITFILGLVILLFFPMVDLAISDWINIGLMFLVSLVFVLTMYNLGLMFSCLARRSTISLISGLFVWIVFVVVVPNASIYIAEQILPPETEDKIEGRLASIREERSNELDELKLPGTGSEAAAVGAFGNGYTRLCDKTSVEYQHKLYSLGVPLRVKYADKLWEVEYGYLNSLSKQRNLANNLSRISPISLYENVMSTLAGTDISGFQSFAMAVKTHRNRIIDYVRSKTANFTSTSYFTPCKEGDYEKFQEENLKVFMEAKNQAEREEAMRNLQKNFEQLVKATSSLNLSDLPRFIYEVDITKGLRRAIPDLALLFVANVLFFTVSFVTFLRYDVR